MDIRSLSLFLLSLTSLNTFATDEVTVYRWVDDNNVVHFSQQKPLADKASSLDAVAIYKASSKSNIVSKLKRKAPEPSVENTKIALNNTETIIDKPSVLSKTSKNNMSKAEVFSKNCEAAKSNMSMLNSFKRVIYPDSNGENRVLTAQEKEDKIKLNTAHIKKYCGNDSK